MRPVCAADKFKQARIKKEPHKKKRKKEKKEEKRKKKGTSYNLNSSNMSSLTRQMVCYTELSENLFLETDKRALLEFFLIGDWINHLSVIIITG